jgi:hypothetical protein
MPIQGRSRIAETYIQVIPVIGDINAQLTGQINSAVNSPQMTQTTQQAGQTIGENVGDTAGAAAGTGMVKQVMAGLAAAGIGTFLAGQVTKVLENGEIESSVKAQLGLTEKQLENVTAASKELLKGNYAGNYEEANAQMKNIVGSIEGARNMSKEQLALMGADMANLTSEYELEAGAVTKAIQTLIGSGLAVDARDAMSTILAGFQNFGGSGDDWVDSLQEFSNGFVNVGLNGKQSVALVSEAIKKGIKDTDSFADSMKEFDMLMAEGGEDYDGVLSQLGLDPKKVKEDFKKGGEAAQKAMLELTGKLQKANNENYWTAIFGPKAQEYFTTFQNMDWTAMHKGLDPNANGDLDKFDKDLTTIMDTITGFKNMLEIAFIDTLTPYVKEAAPYVQQLATFFKDNEEATKILGLTISTVLVGAIAILAMSLWSLVGPVVANPATWILAGILAGVLLLGAGVLWLTKNWEQANAWMTQTWGGFIGFLEDSSGNIYTTFEDMGKNIAEVFQGIVYGVITGINDIIAAINTIHWDAPAYLGGGFGGFNIPTLNVPKFGTGGSVDYRPGGTLAIVAERRPETIVDTGTIQRTLELQNKELEGKGTGGGVHITINPAPGMSIKELVRELKKELVLTGESLA